MRTCSLIVIVHSICTIKCASITTAAVAEGNQAQLIQDLEKEKVIIYKQLNDAVEDTIKTLDKSNDSDATQGLAYMRELLALIDQLNGTEFKIAQAHSGCNGSKECASNQTTGSETTTTKDGRRQGFPGTYKIHGFDYIKHALMATTVFKHEEDLSKIRDEKQKSVIQLQAKLDRWLKLREAEKKKIKLYRLRQASHRHELVTEECPNFGELRKNAKKFAGKSKGGGDSRRSRTYPCCRKCCKKSYLGCL